MVNVEGSAPVSVIEGLGEPAVVTVKLNGLPTTAPANELLVNVGALPGAAEADSSDGPTTTKRAAAVVANATVPNQRQNPRWDIARDRESSFAIQVTPRIVPRHPP
jgi:hypothetical protein